MQKGLCVYSKKIECMIVSKKRDIPTCCIWVYNTKVKQFITSDSRCDKKIKQRTAMSRETFSELKILCNPKITVKTKGAGM